MPETNLSFFHILESLKKTRRTGWIERGVSNPESVSDHSFRMSVMALALAPKLKCNSKKLVELCLVHDLHESLSGDLVLDFSRFGSSFKGVSPEEKKQKELESQKQLFSLLDAKTKKRFESLCNEFGEGKTWEAQIARQLDKLEMLFQAFEYHQAGNFKKEVWPNWLQANEKFIQEPVLKKLLAELASEP